MPTAAAVALLPTSSSCLVPQPASSLSSPAPHPLPAILLPSPHPQRDPPSHSCHAMQGDSQEGILSWGPLPWLTWVALSLGSPVPFPFPAHL